MRLYEPPNPGDASDDQILRLTEKVEVHRKAMLEHSYKLESLPNRVGRSMRSGGGEDQLRLDGQEVAHVGEMAWHGGSAIAWALMTLHAYATNRLWGLNKNSDRSDRRGHKLTQIYKSMLDEVKAEDDIRSKCIENLLDHAYHRSFHQGLVDIEVGGMIYVVLPDSRCRPFSQRTKDTMVDGAEFRRQQIRQPDWNMELLGHPQSFEDLLTKADQSCYSENMHMAHYAIRQFEYGKPFTQIGSIFFDRLIKEIINTASDQSIWHLEFRHRWLNRSLYIRKRNIGIHLEQLANNSDEAQKTIQYKSLEEYMKDGLDRKDPGPCDPNLHNFLHSKIKLRDRDGKPSKDS